MTLGNVMALKQTSIVRMLAYSSIAQGGFILMPLAVAGETGVAESALRAVVTYLIVYAATNLGVFAVVMVVARKTRSGEISSYGGLFSYAPGIATLMTIFMASMTITMIMMTTLRMKAEVTMLKVMMMIMTMTMTMIMM
jgi:NADH-quinone oxidoreductase subunit N